MKRQGNKSEHRTSVIGGIREFHYDIVRSPTFTKTVFVLLAVTFSVTTCLNILSMYTCLPNNWDSIASHLSRAAYFLQFNNLDIFHANYWAHDAHPHNAAILWAYTLGILEAELFTQAIQFLAYVGSGFMVYGLARELRFPRAPACISAMVFLLLVENIMESITVQNDMILLFFSGTAVYFLVIFAKTKQFIHVVLAFAGICLAMGVKGSFLMHVPVWIAFFLYLLVDNQRSNEKPRKKLLAKIGGCMIIFSLMLVFLGDGIGYRHNYLEYHHLIGPEIAQRKSFENKSLNEIMVEGSKNLLRYAFDCISLDGLNHIPGVAEGEVFLKKTAIDGLKRLGVDLESGAMIVKFVPHRPCSDEDFSWWGIMGYMLLPLGLMIALLRTSRNDWLTCTLLLSGGLFILAQAYIGPYDPWRGRYFGLLALLWAPFISILFFPETRMTIFLKAYIISVILLGCLTALLAVVLRDHRPIWMGFKTTRLEQMTTRSSKPGFITPFVNFDRIVPSEATVTICLPPDRYEYLFFGEKRTRTLLPVRSSAGFESKFGPSDYLLYAFDSNCPLHLCPPHKNDLPLGDNYFLRKLSHTLIPTGEVNRGSKGNASITSAVTESFPPYVNSLNMIFRLIPAGSFTMGSPLGEPGRNAEETPHKVRISRPFYMQTTEVTQTQWISVMGSISSCSDNCPDCPVDNVSWIDIQKFIEKLNSMGEGTYRLPTEAEWEYSARAESNKAFANGDITDLHGSDQNLDKIGWYLRNSASTIRPVAHLQPNAWGLYDMHGNVWEWCQDFFGPSGLLRRVRGGSYDNQPFQCRSAFRNGFPSDHRGCNLGFRLVRVP